MSRPSRTVAEGPVLPAEAIDGRTSGRLDSQFQVTPQGAANLSIALWVPPGRAGMQPSLSLQYDSQRGNDLLGVGWALTAGSTITRVRRDTFHDDTAEPVSFSAADPFALDGKRLVLVGGVHGQEGAEYRTHQDTFSRIVLNDADELGPKSFTVFAKDGLVLTYGPTDRSRIVGKRVRFFIPPSGENLSPGWTLRDDLRGVAPVFDVDVRYAWLLSEVRDRAGNAMTFSWVDFVNQNAPSFYGQPSTEKLLGEIRYTGRFSEGLGRVERVRDLGERRVVFNYEQRPDVTDEFISGLRLWHPARLQSIEMYGPNPRRPGLLRVYSLAYKIGSTGRSLLESVTESDAQPPAGISKLPHRFEYSESVHEYEDIDTGITDIRTTPGGRSQLPGRIHVMDIDGDGRDDILYASASRVGFYSFRLARTGADGRPCFSAEYPTKIPLSARPERPMPFDFDQDGRADLMTFDDRQYIGQGYGSQYLISSPTTDPNTGEWSLSPSAAVSIDTAEVADLDGDGRADLLLSTFNTNGTLLHTWSYALNITGLFSAPVPIPWVSPDDHRLVDIDGDGAVELLTCLGQPGGPVINGRWYSALRLARKSATPPMVTSLRTGQRYLFVDLNGDGLTDVVWEGSSPSDIPSVILNSGNGFFQPVGQPFTYAYFGDSAKRAIDYRLDGRKQIVVRYNSMFAPDPVMIIDWNGGTFAAPTFLPMGSICTDKAEVEVFEVLDVNGDGLDDMIMYNNGSLHLYVRKGGKPDLLTRTTDGYGAVTTVTYKPTSDPTVYEPGTHPVVYPSRRHVSKMWVVAEHTEDDGNGGANHYAHRYTDGRIDVRLPGFAGFGGYLRTHLETGETFEADFDLSQRGSAGPFALRGLPTYTSVRTPMSSGLEHVVIRQTEYDLRYDATGQVHFPVATRTREEEGMEDASYFYQIRRVVTTRDVDEFGNDLWVEQKWDTGRRTRTEIQYANRPIDWLIGLPELRTLWDTNSSGTVATTRTEAFEHDNLGMLHRRIVEPGARVAGQWQPLGVQADGVTTLYITSDRNSDGLVTLQTEHDTLLPGASARATAFAYDADEGIFVVDRTNALGHVEQAQWHPGLGVPLVTTDANGLRSTFRYDTFGRLREQNLPGGEILTVHYVDGSVSPPTMTTERIGGIRQRTEYDALGRTTLVSTWSRDDGKEVRQQQSFDALGRVSRSSMPDFAGDPIRWTHYRYDPLDRLLVASLPDNTSWQYAYGDVSPPYGLNALRRTQVREPRGNIRHLIADECGRMVRSVEFDGTASVTDRIEYAPFDVPGSLGGPGGPPITLDSDRLGRTLRVDDPDAGLRQVRYNAFGEVSEVSDPKGLTRFQYDALGRLLESVSPDGTTTYVWDVAANGKGKIAQITSAFNVALQYHYDTAGRIETKLWKCAAGAFEMHYRYDVSGRLQRVRYPKAPAHLPFTVRYDYGNFGQILSVVDDATGKPFWTHLTCDATGSFGRWRLGNGVIEEWHEDPVRAGYLSRITARRGSQMIQHLELSFDAAGNLQKRRDLVDSTSEVFGYDGHNRLTQWTFSSAANAGAVNYRYDALWNLRERLGAGVERYVAVPGSGGPHAAVKTDLGMYAYDSKGNQIQGPGRTVEFTAFDLPRQVITAAQTWSFDYDGEGHRMVKETVTGKHRTVSIAGLYERRDSSSGTEHRYNVVLPGPAVAQVILDQAAASNAPLSSYYLHRDHLSSVRVVTEGSSILDRLAYDPFGRQVDPASFAPSTAVPTSGVTLGFAGHERDEETGLINMRGRMYDPKLARFLTPDPLIADITRASSLNPYAYALQNPQTLRDPTGFSPHASSAPSAPSAPAADSCRGSCTMEGDTVIGTVGSDPNVPGGSDNGVDAAPPTESSQPSTMTFDPVDIYLSEFPVVDIYLTGFPAVDIYLRDYPPTDIYLTGYAPEEIVLGEGRNTFDTQPVGNAANVLTVIGALEGADKGLATASNILAQGRSWIGTGRLGRASRTALDLLATAAARASMPANNILSRAIRLGRTLTPVGVRPVLNIVGKMASGAGVAISAYNFATATGRADRVQAMVDGTFSAVGFTGLGTLGSAAYSGTQLLDQATGFTDAVSKWGFRESGSRPTRAGNWLADQLGL